jgi:hypothetical protein
MKNWKKLLLYAWLLGGMLFAAAFTGTPYQADTPPQPLSVIIVRPGDGETIYDGPQTMLYSIFVTGVVHTGVGNPALSELKLEIFSGNNRIGMYTGHSDAHGDFSVPVTVNPDKDSNGLTELQLDPRAGCQTACHFAADLSLLPGTILIRATVIMPDGQQAYSDRQVSVDRSGYASIPVRVLTQDRLTPLAGILVTGGARMYMWRTHYATATTDDKGNATLKVEALAEAPTHYILRIEPSVVGGVLYQSVDTAEVTLPPGATTISPVTLHVSSQRGQVTGQVSGGTKTLQLWAIHLPDGSAQQTQTTTQGAFSFTDLPIGQYLITTDLQSLAAHGLVLKPQELDLTQSPGADLSLSTGPLEGRILRGNVSNASGAGLPFAWLSTEVQTVSTDPASGVYFLKGLPDSKSAVTASAPGYYSQAQVIEPSQSNTSSLDFHLTRRPETRLLPWGQGTVVLPSETSAQVNDQLITFNSGWLWGSGNATKPLVVQVGKAQIIIHGGSFALEGAASQTSWLYQFSGQASIQQGGDLNPVTVDAGYMILLGKSTHPLPVNYDPVVVQALQPIRGAPISPVWQPTMGAQIQAHLAQIGIGAAQVVTFIMYSLMILLVVGLPLAGIYWLAKRKRIQEVKHNLD